MSSSCSITINGETHSIDSDTTISALLGSLQLEAEKVAIERNLEILPHSLYGNTKLSDGDSLEIVHFIGGG